MASSSDSPGDTARPSAASRRSSQSLVHPTPSNVTQPGPASQQQHSASPSGSSIHLSASSTIGAGDVPPLPEQTPPNAQKVTVETETVPSVPTLGVVSSSANGTLRVKRSQESVPRVSAPRVAAKKRSQRLAQGSKADIFAARVANAVDEQDSSGSDETFVYDTTQQPPNAANHAGDSMRRPFQPRTLSSTSPLYYNEDLGYFSDDVPYDSELYQGMPPAAAQSTGTSTRSTTTMSESEPISPYVNSRQNPANLGPHSFLVPKTYGQQLRQQQRQQFQNQRRASRPVPLSLEQDGIIYDDAAPSPREAAWPKQFQQHTRRNSRPRVLSENASPVKDPNDSIRAKHSYLQRWRTPAHTNSPFLDDATPELSTDEHASLLHGRPSLYNYHSRSTGGRRKGHNSTAQSASMLGAGNEGAPYSPTDSEFTKLSNHASFAMRLFVCGAMSLVVLMSFAFVVGLLLAASRPLRDFEVGTLSDVFVSDKELVFSMTMHARNPGLFSIIISEGSLDVFATTAYSAETKDKGTVKTLFLGTITELESPVAFHGGFSGATQWRSASTKLVNPLANNTALWSTIMEHEFDMTVKGVLTYKVMGGMHRETVSRSHPVAAPEVIDLI